MTTNKPQHKLTAGAIDLAIWMNVVDTPTGRAEVLKAQVERRYKANDGSYKSTTSFGINDIPRVQYLLAKAYDYILTQQAEAREQRRQEHSGPPRMNTGGGDYDA